MMDALVPISDEGRAKLRYATTSRKGALTRGSPNGVTQEALLLILKRMRNLVK
jgi:hypothetical protein